MCGRTGRCEQSRSHLRKVGSSGGGALRAAPVLVTELRRRSRRGAGGGLDRSVAEDSEPRNKPNGLLTKPRKQFSGGKVGGGASNLCRTQRCSVRRGPSEDSPGAGAGRLRPEEDVSHLTPRARFAGRKTGASDLAKTKARALRRPRGADRHAGRSGRSRSACDAGRGCGPRKGSSHRVGGAGDGLPAGGRWRRCSQTHGDGGRGRRPGVCLRAQCVLCAREWVARSL